MAKMRITCGYCGKRLNLRKDGRVPKHRDTRWSRLSPPCRGAELVAYGLSGPPGWKGG